MSRTDTTRAPRRIGAVAAILAFALIAAGCAVEGSEGADAAASESAQSEGQTSTTESLVLPTADGGQIDWNSLEGQDVMLWFWAPW